MNCQQETNKDKFLVMAICNLSGKIYIFREHCEAYSSSTRIWICFSRIFLKCPENLLLLLLKWC